MPRCQFRLDTGMHLVLSILLIVLACDTTHAQSTQSQNDNPDITYLNTDTVPDGSGQDVDPAEEMLSEQRQQSAEDQSGSDGQNESGVFDIEMLIERMKQTDAIGVISKLSLKNKVDDLLEQARIIKEDDSDTDKSEQTEALRENFEGLILKTVTLLNKGEDYSLAEDIYLAREQLWKSIMENKA